jgi:hypothetical protein
MPWLARLVAPGRLVGAAGRWRWGEERATQALGTHSFLKPSTLQRASKKTSVSIVIPAQAGIQWLCGRLSRESTSICSDAKTGS